MGLQGQKVNSFVVLLDIAKFFSQRVVPVYIPNSNVWEYLFPSEPQNRMCCHIFCHLVFGCNFNCLSLAMRRTIEHFLIYVGAVSESFSGGECELCVNFSVRFLNFLIFEVTYALGKLAISLLCFCFNMDRIYQSFLLLHWFWGPS